MTFCGVACYYGRVFRGARLKRGRPRSTGPTRHLPAHAFTGGVFQFETTRELQLLPVAGQVQLPTVKVSAKGTCCIGFPCVPSGL